MSALTSRYSPPHFDGIGTLVPFARSTQIYGECEPVKYLYMIVKGAVRTCRMTLDGRRRIVGFYFAGDLFGFEAGDAHTLSAEAVSPAIVRMIRRTVIAASAGQQEQIAHFLCKTLYREIAREQEHIVRLGKPALERVADFLLEMARRFPHSVALELPMSRRDIADHLDITIETLSRALRQLMKRAALESVQGHRITLGARGTLTQICEHSPVTSRDRQAPHTPSDLPT
jgi:CRP/FNR family nitrogen fixation transcriptional regulator